MEINFKIIWKGVKQMKVWNWLKVALGIVFSIFVYLFFTRKDNRKIKEAIDEVNKKVDIEKTKVKKIEKRIITRKKKAKDLSDRLKKHFNNIIIIAIFVGIIFSGSIILAEPEIENLIIPDNYADLLIAYKDIAEIAIGYQNLYQESESDNQALMEIIKNLQSLIEVQQDIIDDLLQKNRFSIFTGLNIVPLKPAYSGIIAGIEFEW